MSFKPYASFGRMLFGPVPVGCSLVPSIFGTDGP